MTRYLASFLVLASMASAEAPVDIGSARQLFVDDRLISSRQNVSLLLHQPQTREIVLKIDKPWESPDMTFVSVLKDGDKYVMYYRGGNADAKLRASAPPGFNTYGWTYTCRAESADGINWTKPNYGAIEYNGSTANNLVWPNDENKAWRNRNYPATDMFPFRDENPDAPADQRYKVLANVGEYELAALVSPDGIHWRRLQAAPVIGYLPGDSMMDPPSVSFWDPNTKQYVAYLRRWINFRLRGFRRVTSPDYIHWSRPVDVNYLGGEVENLYTSMAVAYDRAPNLYLFFSKRFARTNRADKVHGGGLSEIVFLSSHDGINFNHEFMEPFLSPGLDKNNWHPRGIMMGRGILDTSPTELSLYYLENYQKPTARIRRATIRPDGFVSVHAPWEGGEFTTKPLRFQGSELEINYATSVAGYVRVELEDEQGRPLPGYRLNEGPEIFGDEIAHTVVWNPGHSDMLDANHHEIHYSAANFGRPFAGKAIRLHFVMKAADLYSFRISSPEAGGASR